MPLDTLLIDGDVVLFDPIFIPENSAPIPATVMVRPTKIEASGKTIVKGQKVCVEGDETKVLVTNCNYTSAAFPIPGFGDLKIKSLTANQTTQKSKSQSESEGGIKTMLLRGTVFNAHFEVKSPAQLPIPGSAPKKDDATLYKGTGKFIPVNSTIKAT